MEKKMTVTVRQLENDPAWSRSLGEKLDKIHFRKGKMHAECNPVTEVCKIHHDRTDPHESIPSLLIHMAQSQWRQDCTRSNCCRNH